MSHPWPLQHLHKKATIVILLIVLRYFLKKRSKTQSRLISDLKQVGNPIENQRNDQEFEYDIVIVGGGTAGCVLAARISEDPALKVLLLEAGESSIPLTFSKIPGTFYKLFRTKHDYNLYTVPQENAGGTRKYWPRAKLLGGCSAINAMMFQCGAPSDYDEWVKLQKGALGSSGWAYQEFQPYFQRFEKYIPSKRFPSVDVSLRGSTGPVELGYFGNFSLVAAKFIAACVKTGIPHSNDVNTHQGTLGVTKLMTFINAKSRRVTTESAYLTSEVLARPNLKVATNAHTTRIIFDTRHEGGPRAVGVEFANTIGQMFRVKARREVVLSAGAVHTPQILMLSGVGPANHLSSHNIPVVADLPGVGSHLMDHIVVDLAYRSTIKKPFGFLPGDWADTAEMTAAMLQYQLTGKGFLTTNVGEAAAFIRSSETTLYPTGDFPVEDTREDNTSGPGAPDIELFATPMAYQKEGHAFDSSAKHFGLHAVLLRPTSTGTIRLSSASPYDPPVVDPKYLSTRHDVAVLVRAVRLLTRIARTEPLALLVDPIGDNDPATQHKLHEGSDTELEEFIRKRAETLYHPVCSARMAPLEDDGVVDPFLRVHGIPNLRIVDASVLPTIVSGHTTGPTIALAERAAALIKATDLIEAALNTSVSVPFNT